jgi:hypothetical protein
MHWVGRGTDADRARIASMEEWLGRGRQKKNEQEIDRKWDESCKGVRREQRRE